MKKTLIDKYLNGKTSPTEEKALRQMLLDVPDGERTETERALLLMLSKVDNSTDIFAVDYSAEYDAKIQSEQTQAKLAEAEIKDMPKDIELKPKIQRRWYVGIAASVAALVMLALQLMSNTDATICYMMKDGKYITDEKMVVADVEQSLTEVLTSQDIPNIENEFKEVFNSKKRFK